MADTFCSFLDFRSLSTHCSLNSLLPSKHIPTSPFQSHKSRIGVGRRKPIHLTLASNPSSPDFDVISTHVNQNPQPTDCRGPIKDYKEHSDGSFLFRFGDPSLAPKIVEVEKTENVNEEIETEDKDGYNVVTVIDGDTEKFAVVKTVSVPEKESISIDQSVEDSTFVESSLFDVSNIEVKVSAVEDGAKEEQENSFPTANELILEESLKTEIDIAELESPDSEVADVTIPDAPVVTAYVYGISENQNLKDEMQKKENGAGSELLSSSPPLELALRLSEADEVEDQKFHGGMENVVTENDRNNAVATSTETEEDATLSTSPETGICTSNETERLYETLEDGTENAEIHSVSVTTLSETDTMLDEETVEESGEDDGSESPLTLSHVSQESTLESESTQDLVDVINSELTEESGLESGDLEPSVSAIDSLEIQTTEFVLSSGAVLLPHPSKVLAGGEDAYFVAGQKWLGVADGVSCWSLEGTIPGVYAQELMKNCKNRISGSEGDSIANPLELLNLTTAETRSPGAATVLVAQLNDQALHVANIGDSGFIVLREGAVHKRSSPMLHVFHFPIQLERDDDPSHLAELYKIDLEEKDVIITATDGLLDNLYDQEISSIVSNSLSADKKPEEIAESLARKAQEMGQSAFGRSPFADSAQAAGYAGYTGGKLDDVTVIVSVVQRQSQ